MHVITPSDLLKFQIEHYSEMLEKPRSFEHKIFLRKQLKQLYGNRNENLCRTSGNNGDMVSKVVSERGHQNVERF